MAIKYSIAIPAYNRPEYLRQAIASCIMQTVEDFEVIVSDDCSSDDLRSVADSFHDPRVKYYRTESRLKAAKNHQHAVSRSTGTYVITLNSDDLLLPKCLEIAGTALNQYLPAAAVYFSCARLRGAEVQGFHSIPKIHFADVDTLRENPWLESFTNVNPSCCLFRRSAFDLIGGYRTNMRFAYDWEIYMRFLTAGGGVAFLPQILSIYRMHDEQMIQTSGREGLYDVLDSWQTEYSHWSASEIADLILLSCRRDKRIYELFKELTNRHLVGRVISGIPGALYRKLRRRIAASPNELKIEEHYEEPVNRDDVLQSITMGMQAILRLCADKMTRLDADT